MPPVTAFDRLHPALQHHIVSSLGWGALRPLQEEAIEPLLVGAHALVIGPTAGGKTEAGVFDCVDPVRQSRIMQHAIRRDPHLHEGGRIASVG